MSYLEELLPEFRKGAKIRQNDWDEDVFIRFYKDEIYWYDDGSWKDGKIASTKDLVSLFTFHKDNWELYKEPELDWDYIIKNKCLCWFWDGSGDYKALGILIKVNENNTLCRYDCKKSNGDYYQYANCRPVRRNEITFYEDKNNE